MQWPKRREFACYLVDRGADLLQNYIYPKFSQALASQSPEPNATHACRLQKTFFDQYIVIAYSSVGVYFRAFFLFQTTRLGGLDDNLKNVSVCAQPWCKNVVCTRYRVGEQTQDQLEEGCRQT